MPTQNQSSLISSIYNSRNNIIDHMNLQGFNVSDYSNFSINEINTMAASDQLDMLFEMPDRKSYIRYFIKKPIRLPIVEEIVDDLFNIEEVLTPVDTLYIIVKDDINDSMVGKLNHLWEKDGIFIVMINIDRLQFNILDHTLVPPHRIMSSDEINNMKQKYNISANTELPEISRYDPVAQVIGMRPTDVCEISRTSKTSIDSKYYRICV